ncbi:unnamed protein product [Leuciscus chuanchicus]
MFLPNTRALAVVCWIMCVRITVSQASVPAPVLNFASSVNESNIVLNTLLVVSCYAPRGAPYPLTLSVGRLESPSQTPETTEPWVTSQVVNYASSVDFNIPAIAKYEGKIVCWYQSTRTELKNSYSEFSNTVPLVVSALPPPTVSLHPSVFLVGGNYTVYCDSTAGPVTNFTLSLYYRILPVTPGTNWTFAGSVFLTDGNRIYSRYTNAVVQIEFVCTMGMLYNGKVLHSLQSKIEQAIPEELPVRLWEQNRGESCLGDLDVKIRGMWEPVCQQEVNASVAIATANVVCRELGCGHVLVWRILENNRHFSGKIGGFRCSGKEEKTRDCPMNENESCKNRGSLYIVCSDALPPPKLSVMTYGPVPKLYGYIVFRKNGVILRDQYSKPGTSASITQSYEVAGEYDCVYRLYSSKIQLVSQPSNTVFIYIYNPPDPVPIVAGVLTTVIGIAILTYICIYRTATQEVQGNEFPAHSQDPATNAENPYPTVHIPQQP